MSLSLTCPCMSLSTDAVFGCHLDTLCHRENSTVPRFVQKCVRFVERRGLDTDGIYRVSGNLAVIQKLRHKVDQGENSATSWSFKYTTPETQGQRHHQVTLTHYTRDTRTSGQLQVLHLKLRHKVDQEEHVDLEDGSWTCLKFLSLVAEEHVDLEDGSWTCLKFLSLVAEEHVDLEDEEHVDLEDGSWTCLKFLSLVSRCRGTRGPGGRLVDVFKVLVSCLSLQRNTWTWRTAQEHVDLEDGSWTCLKFLSLVSRCRGTRGPGGRFVDMFKVLVSCLSLQRNTWTWRTAQEHVDLETARDMFNVLVSCLVAEEHVDLEDDSWTCLKFLSLVSRCRGTQEHVDLEDDSWTCLKFLSLVSLQRNTWTWRTTQEHVDLEDGSWTCLKFLSLVSRCRGTRGPGGRLVDMFKILVSCLSLQRNTWTWRTARGQEHVDLEDGSWTCLKFLSLVSRCRGTRGPGGRLVDMFKVLVSCLSLQRNTWTWRTAQEHVDLEDGSWTCLKFLSLVSRCRGTRGPGGRLVDMFKVLVSLVAEEHVDLEDEEHVDLEDGSWTCLKFLSLVSRCRGTRGPGGRLVDMFKVLVSRCRGTRGPEDGSWTEVHVVTGALKLFFRELPEPLFPFSSYDKFIAAIQLPEFSQRVSYIKDLVQTLPLPNHSTMELLFRHLRRVVDHGEQNRMSTHSLAIVVVDHGDRTSWWDHGDQNRMSTHSLAIVFGPTLLRPQVESNMTVHMGVPESDRGAAAEGGARGVCPAHLGGRGRGLRCLPAHLEEREGGQRCLPAH
ncbi:hypothetical protein WMY93_031984 [Mugilogobius chulae]|uniref:Rho-GAP domain-containing protein n=1 Tax=Mugilogobius chulae TaxID=88201 RepID=A0AAW0MEZ5_9GOBI